MAVLRPYRRTVRAFKSGKYSEGGQSRYIDHPRYATAPERYVRAFAVIHKDLLELFDFVEPADKNLSCYSYKIHALLMRTCIEVEANLKAILSENGYCRPNNWNMDDYRKVEASHRLSEYEVKLPVWHGVGSTRSPFSAWRSSTGRITWYQDYNAAKHDRHTAFDRASLDSLMDAVAAMAALLCSQFLSRDYGPGEGYVLAHSPQEGFDEIVLEYYSVKLPTNWPPSESYDFDWQPLLGEPDPFQNYPY